MGVTDLGLILPLIAVPLAIRASDDLTASAVSQRRFIRSREIGTHVLVTHITRFDFSLVSCRLPRRLSLRIWV